MFNHGNAMHSVSGILHLLLLSQSADPDPDATTHRSSIEALLSSRGCGEHLPSDVPIWTVPQANAAVANSFDEPLHRAKAEGGGGGAGEDPDDVPRHERIQRAKAARAARGDGAEVRGGKQVWN